jgi:hypothetical protein
MLSEINKGEFIEPPKQTVGEWLDDWVEKAIKPPSNRLNVHDVQTVH